MERITPHLWFDNQAKEAGALYTSVFPDSRIKNTTVLHNTPSGSVDIVTIELGGQEFTLLSAGPLFRFNPSISFLVACERKEEVDQLWAKLSEGGTPLMEIGSYPFSERYGWLQDRYGLSWQLMHAGGGREIGQKITPVMMFVGKQSGRAEEAIRCYTSVFRDSGAGDMNRYGAGEEPDREGTIRFGRFTLESEQFAAMDSAGPHDFAFNEAVSLMVHCDTQQDVDELWDKLLAGGGTPTQCGWLKDRFGLSWQVIPDVLPKLLAHPDREKAGRAMHAMMQMVKIDGPALQRAFDGA